MSDIRESGSCLVVGFKGLGIQLRTECSFREFRSDDQVSHLRVSESPALDHLRVSESREFDHLLRSDCDGLCIRSQGVGFHGVGILSIRLRTVRITRYCIAAGSVVRLLAVGPQVSYRCWVSRQIAGCWTTGCRTAAVSVIRLLAVGPQGVVPLLGQSSDCWLLDHRVSSGCWLLDHRVSSGCWLLDHRVSSGCWLLDHRVSYR